MKTKHVSVLTAAAVAAAVAITAGCERQSRGNADAAAESRAMSPEEGGATTTSGSAGQAKNFGDTSRSGAHGGATNPETPKQHTTRESNEPANQPRKSTDAISEREAQPGESATSGASLVGEKK